MWPKSACDFLAPLLLSRNRRFAEGILITRKPIPCSIEFGAGDGGIILHNYQQISTPHKHLPPLAKCSFHKCDLGQSYWSVVTFLITQSLCQVIALLGLQGHSAHDEGRPALASTGQHLGSNHARVMANIWIDNFYIHLL